MNAPHPHTQTGLGDEAELSALAGNGGGGFLSVVFPADGRITFRTYHHQPVISGETVEHRQHPQFIPRDGNDVLFPQWHHPVRCPQRPLLCHSSASFQYVTCASYSSPRQSPWRLSRLRY